MIKKGIFIFLIVVGIVLRIYNIEKVPAGLFADEAALAINAKTIAQDGIDEFGNKLPFGFESFGDYKSPGYIYITSLFFNLLGPRIITVRLAAVLASLLTIPLLGYLVYILIPKQKLLPYLSMIVLALSPFHIHFARIAYETTVATLFLLLYLISLVQLLQGEKRRWLWVVVGSISIAISMWTYPAPRFIIPVFTVLILLWYFIGRTLKKNVVYMCLFFLFVVFLSYLPFLLSPVIDKRPLGYIFNLQNGNIFLGIFHKSMDTLSSWLRIFDLEFLFFRGDPFALRHGTGETGLLLSIFLIPFILGILYLIRMFSIKNFFAVFLLLLLVVLGLPSSLTSQIPYGPRLLPMILPLSIVAALGLEQSIIFLEKRSKQVKMVAYILFFAVLVYQIGYFARVYFVHFAIKSLPEFPKASVDVSLYIKGELDKNPERKIYFLNRNYCVRWGHEGLKLWYFANLENRDMVAWNTAYRNQRIAAGDAFLGFDTVPRERYEVKNIIFDAGQEEMSRAPIHALLIRCGFHSDAINSETEKIQKVFYQYEAEKRDAIYIVSEKIKLK